MFFSRELTESKAAGACAIREAAMELFAQSGFDAVSLAGIASRAGVCKANIFHHFESKEALYKAVLMEACRDHAELSESLLDEPVPSRDKLRRLIAFELDQMRRFPVRMRLIYREFLHMGAGQGQTVAAQVFRRNMLAVQSLIRQGQASGEFRAGPSPAVAAWTLGSALVVYFQNRAWLPELHGMAAYAEDDEAFGNGLVDLLQSGLLAVPKASPDSSPDAAEQRSPR